MQVALDCRLGGAPKLRLVNSEAELMQLPDEVRKCVVMLSYQGTDGREWFAGTGFFVGVPGSSLASGSEAPKRKFIYLVTAKHVILKAHRDSIDRHVIIRINEKDGNKSAKFGVAADEWKDHPQENSCDVAVLQWNPPAHVDIRLISQDDFVTNEKINEVGLGIGTEVFMTGLFRSHQGSHRNIPIVRSGLIAAMPEEPINTKMGKMDGYLVEVRSVGGLSGSPVFAFLRGIRFHDGQRRKYLRVDLIQLHFLGLVHGHWDVEKMKMDVAEQDAAQNDEINVGITIVTPASKLTETLNREDFVQTRAEICAREREEDLPTMDAAGKETVSFGRSEFEAALRRVSRRVAEPDEGTS